MPATWDITNRFDVVDEITGRWVGCVEFDEDGKEKNVSKEREEWLAVHNPEKLGSKSRRTTR